MAQNKVLVGSFHAHLIDPALRDLLAERVIPVLHAPAVEIFLETMWPEEMAQLDLKRNVIHRANSRFNAGLKICKMRNRRLGKSVYVHRDWINNFCTACGLATLQPMRSATALNAPDSAHSTIACDRLPTGYMPRDGRTARAAATHIQCSADEHDE